MEPAEKTLDAGTVFDTLCRWGGLYGLLGILLLFLFTSKQPTPTRSFLLASFGFGILFWAVSTGHALWHRPRRTPWAAPVTLLLVIAGLCGGMCIIAGWAEGSMVLLEW